MSTKYKGLIEQNCAPPNVSMIGIYGEDGERKGKIKVPSDMLAPKEEKLYSFGAISDAHTYAKSSYTSDTTANADFIRALNFYKNNSDFLCICGDMTCYGIGNGDLSHYKQLIDTNAGALPVYAMAGNHEWWGGTITSEIMNTYTGHDLYYSFKKDNDVFIMCGMASADYNFTVDELQWLYGVLEENRNKRCFLFCHGMILGYSGDPTSIYPFDILSGTNGEVFKNLLRHYKNTIYFHGHSHILFQSQLFTQNNDIPNCIYDDHLGIHSIHIPSLAIPIDITSGTRQVVSQESQGYLIDVYNNEIMLRGRDFVTGKYIAISQYKLNTVLKQIEANAFVDSTGTITTIGG